MVNKDFNTYENLSRYVDLLNESIFKRDSKYLKNEIVKFKETYDYLLENLTSLLNCKQQIKESSLNFYEIKSKFYKNLNKIDTRLNELNLPGGLFAQTADLIIYELDHIEKQSLNECSKLLSTASECTPGLSTIQQNSSAAVLNEEIKQNLIHMKTSFNNTVNNLNTLKQKYEDVVVKENKFNTTSN